MSFRVVPTPLFERELKGLSKRYASIKKDLSGAIASLIVNPKLGESLGNNCYKVRMAITSKNKGKSGGARIITCLKIVEETIFLVSIYDKSDTDTITDQEILRRVKDL